MSEREDALERRRRLILIRLHGGPMSTAALITCVAAAIPGTQSEHVKGALARLMSTGDVEHGADGYSLARPPSRLDDLLRIAKERGVSVWHMGGDWHLPLPEGTVSGKTPGDVIWQLDAKTERAGSALVGVRNA